MPKQLEHFAHPKYSRLVLFRHDKSPFFNARIYLDGALKQSSLKTSDPKLAKKLAETWYVDQLRLSREHPPEDDSRLSDNPLLLDLFRSYRTTLRSERARAEADKRWGPIQHFWRALKLKAIGSATFEDFYRWRAKVKPHTLHKDICLLRQVLKWAELNIRDFALPRIPKHDRIRTNPRPWLTHKEWQTLCETMVAEIDGAKNRRTRQQRQDASDFARFMVASMCRVEELQTLRFRDCKVEPIPDRPNKPVLRCEFTGKTGSRTAFASRDAVIIYERRFADDADALIFPHHPRDAFRHMLEEAHLYVDSFGDTRNYKSLRATAISFAILQPTPPTLLQIARNAGTSVEVIDKYYAKRLTAEHGKAVLTDADPLLFAL